MNQDRIDHLCGTASLAFGNTEGDATAARLAAQNDADEIGATEAELAEAIDRFESDNDL